MTKLRTIIVSIGLMLMAAVALVACGGENPTPTPVPPTPTTPPTVAAIQPTATTAAVPTSTTAAVAPSATSGGAQATGTTGSGTASGTGTPSGNNLNESDQALVNDAVTASENYTSYHYMLSATGDVYTQTVKVEGDYVRGDSPDTSRNLANLTVGNNTTQQLIVGSTVYTKDSNGNWVPAVTPTPSSDLTSGLFSIDSLTGSADVVGGLRSLVEAGTNYKDLGQENVSGVQTRHFSFDLDTAKLFGSSAEQMQEMMGGTLPSLGSGEIWIDPASHNLYRYKMNFDAGAFIGILAQEMSAISGTPTPGGPAPTAIPSMTVNLDLTLSKLNDPSISVPTPPAGSGTESETPVP